MSFAENIERNYSLREKCPNLEFFWSVFPCIRTEYGELLRIWTLFTQWFCKTPLSGKFWASGDLIIFLKFILFKPRRCSSRVS